MGDSESKMLGTTMTRFVIFQHESDIRIVVKGKCNFEGNFNWEDVYNNGRINKSGSKEEFGRACILFRVFISKYLFV